jgi:hypothetical protein
MRVEVVQEEVKKIAKEWEAKGESGTGIWQGGHE